MTHRPTRTLNKVSLATAAAAASTILLWVLETSFTVDIPGVIEVALTTLLTFAAGYMTPLAEGEIEHVETDEQRRLRRYDGPRV